jgi:hypothetical protein
MKSTGNARKTGRHEETIKATMEKLFPLACPVAEYKWIDGWDFEMVYSECGAMEKHCIFRERLTGAFLFADPDHGQEQDKGSTKVTWNYTITGLNDDANEALAALEPGKIDAMLGFLGKSLKHYCETGEKLPAKDALEQAQAS